MRIDAFSVFGFREAFAAVAPAARRIIDLSGVTFVDSAGLGALIGVIRRTHEQRGEAAVVCARPTLVHLLADTGFDDPGHRNRCEQGRFSTMTLEWDPTVVDAVEPMTKASVRNRSQT